MARVRLVLPDAADIKRLVDDEGRIAVRVTPGARIESLELAQGKLLAKVRAKPQDGEANEAVARLLASALGVAPSRVELLRGASSPRTLPIASASSAGSGATSATARRIASAHWPATALEIT